MDDRPGEPDAGARRSRLGEKLWGPWFLPFLVRRQERAIREKALEVLEFVDLWHLRNESAGNLSSGQKKLLELARTLMCDPQLILLDEPGAGVNPTLMKRLVACHRGAVLREGDHLLHHRARHGLGDPAVQPGHRAEQGEKIAEGLPDEIKADERVLEAYLGGQYR